MSNASQSPRRVAVVGGGPAGLEAARVAASRGHDVDLYEASDHLGGVLWPAATPEFKSELRKMITWWERQLAELPVRIHLGTTITASSPELDGVDDVIVATGAAPVVPASIPGIERAVEVVDAHLDRSRVGHRVIVAGGGLSGVDLALELAEDGHAVTVVEMADEIAADLLIINKITLLRRLEAAGVRVLTGHAVTRVTDTGLVAEGPDGPVELEADTVVAAFGVRADRGLAEALEGRTKVHAVGDCVHPAKVAEAVNAGFEAAFAL